MLTRDTLDIRPAEYPALSDIRYPAGYRIKVAGYPDDTGFQLPDIRPDIGLWKYPDIRPILRPGRVISLVSK
jgi:hypothetical protein